MSQTERHKGCLDEVFVKRGEKYFSIGHFDGFPSDGLWWVNSSGGCRSEHLLIPAEKIDVWSMGPIPEAAKLASMEIHREAACRGIQEALETAHKSGYYPSANQIVTAIFEAIAKEENKNES